MVRPTALIRVLAPNQTRLSLVEVNILVEKSIVVVKHGWPVKQKKKKKKKSKPPKKRAIALCSMYKNIIRHKYNNREKKNEQIPKKPKRNTKIKPGTDCFPSNPVDDGNHAPPWP